MKLTMKSEYSLLALIYIARHKDGGFIRIEEICARYGLPKKYLEHLLSALKQSGYVTTRRGSGGGYKLARPARKISMAEVIRLMDGPLAPTESVSRYFFAPTPLAKEKKVLSVLKRIRDYTSETLERRKLSDLV